MRTMQAWLECSLHKGHHLFCNHLSGRHTHPSEEVDDTCVRHGKGGGQVWMRRDVSKCVVQMFTSIKSAVPTAIDELHPLDLHTPASICGQKTDQIRRCFTSINIIRISNLNPFLTPVIKLWRKESARHLAGMR